MSLKLPINDTLRKRIEIILQAFEKTDFNAKSLEGMDRSETGTHETRSRSLDAKSGTTSDAKTSPPYGADGIFTVSDKDKIIYTEDINLGKK